MNEPVPIYLTPEPMSYDEACGRLRSAQIRHRSATAAWQAAIRDYEEHLELANRLVDEIARLQRRIRQYEEDDD